MTAPANGMPPRRVGSLRMIEKFTGGTNVVILTTGKTEKDTEVKNRNFAIPSDKNWLIKDVDEKKLPIDNVEFTADRNGFITGLWLPKNGTGPATPDPEKTPATFTPASEIKAGTPPANPSPAKDPAQANLTGSGGSSGTSNPPSGKTPDPGKDDARRDPAWTNYSDKEDWLRYISSTNIAMALLESVWQPDPAKPQAENIADKIKWVRSISSGIRAHYAKEKGGAP